MSPVKRNELFDDNSKLLMLTMCQELYIYNHHSIPVGYIPLLSPVIDKQIEA